MKHKPEAHLIAAKAMCRVGAGGACLCHSEQFRKHCIAERIWGEQARQTVEYLDIYGYLRDPPVGFKARLQRLGEAYSGFLNRVVDWYLQIRPSRPEPPQVPRWPIALPPPRRKP